MTGPGVAREQLALLYQRYGSVRQVALRVGWDRGRTRRALCAGGVAVPDRVPSLPRPDVTCADAKALYLRGLSIRQVAAELRCSYSTARQRLLDAGVDVSVRSNFARRQQQ